MNPSFYLPNSNLTPISKVIKDNQIYKDYSSPFSSLANSIVLSGSLSERLPRYIDLEAKITSKPSESLNSLQKARLEKEKSRVVSMSKSKRNYECVMDGGRVERNFEHKELLKYPSSTTFHESKYFNYDYILEVRRRKRLNTMIPKNFDR
jgi:hypothetical protein